eukprot:scaffold6803_cov60-Cylindrotheca_fusiformis.AAC.5
MELGRMEQWYSRIRMNTLDAGCTPKKNLEYNRGWYGLQEYKSREYHLGNVSAAAMMELGRMEQWYSGI